MRKPHTLTMLLTICLPALAASANWNDSLYYWGGVDRNSHVYWPVKPIDMRPLELAKLGKREEAFQYCFSRIGSSKSEQKAFYIVQAASFGFGLKKTHIVYAKVKSQLLPNGFHRSSSSPTDIDERVLLLAFVASVASMVERPYPDWETVSRKSTETSSIVSASLDVSYTRTEHKFIQAAIAANSLWFGKARLLQEQALMKTPDSADAWLALARTYMRGGDQIGHTVEIDTVRSLRFIRKARTLDPSNARAKYLEAAHIYSTDPALASKLFRQFLDSKVGSPGEREFANETLTRLARRKS